MPGNDEHTLLLLHGEDLADSSPYNKSITNNGVSISSAQSKFGGKSLYFNGSSNLSIDLPVTGDMTVDFWAYIQDSSISFPTPFGWDYNGGRCNYIHTLSSVTWFAQNDGRDSIEVSTTGIAHNSWHHIALVRFGNTLLGFIDGVLKTTSAVNYGNNDTLTIGVLNAAKSSTWFTGFIDEFRVSDIARWNEDFTPPTEPYSSPAPPPAPETIQQLLSVRIAWSAVDGAASYNVYRNGTLLTSTTDTAYIDLTAAENQEYTYGVSAVGPTGESEQATLTVYTKSGYFLYKPVVESATFQ